MPQNEPGLRQYLVANLFDGDEAGEVTMTTSTLLDEVCQLVAHWMIDATGTGDWMESYYGETEKDDTPPKRELRPSDRLGLSLHSEDLLSPEQKRALHEDLAALAQQRRHAEANARNVVLD